VSPEVVAFHGSSSAPALALACVLAEGYGDNLLGAIEHAVRFTAIAGIGSAARYGRSLTAFPATHLQGPFHRENAR
jgi:hypothetical protein